MAGAEASAAEAAVGVQAGLVSERRRRLVPGDLRAIVAGLAQSLVEALVFVLWRAAIGGEAVPQTAGEALWRSTPASW